jgi:hypothetical protein
MTVSFSFHTRLRVSNLSVGRDRPVNLDRVSDSLEVAEVVTCARQAS